MPRQRRSGVRPTPVLKLTLTDKAGGGGAAVTSVTGVVAPTTRRMLKKLPGAAIIGDWERPSRSGIVTTPLAAPFDPGYLP